MLPQEGTISSEEVVEIVGAEPVSEASVADVVAAAQGVVLARAGSEGQGIENREQGTEEALTQTQVADDAPSPTSELHKNGRLRDVLECMLFVSTEPIGAKQLADTLHVEESAIDEAMTALESRLDGGSGIQLMRVAGGYQLCTRPEFADYCAIILQPAKKRLSKAALETLAIVAYRQPCTQPEVESVRGVSVDGVVKTLMERGLVKEAGRKQTPGRPILYATTPEFLEYFGLNDISELPDIDLLAVEQIKALEAQKELFARGEAPVVGEKADAPVETSQEASVE